MKNKISLIVTSIASPNETLKALAKGCKENNYHFIVIGDQDSPQQFQLDGCDFYGLQKQAQTDLKFAQNCPTKHYARKNIGYLLAIADKTSIIIETDDDNIPYPNFWAQRQRIQKTAVIENNGWTNIHQYFTDQNIWPRGFPLDFLNEKLPDFNTLKKTDLDCPIQQGLANDNPDVDAIYRLTMPLPQKFKNNRQVALTNGSWCPFNSQNTTWWPDAFELLYLPSYCSFRMTDIWRSFIAQKICWLNDWAILFHEPTVTQKRNEHNLLKDFADEIPGYLHNNEFREALETLPLQPGTDKITDNLKICYEKLISMSLLDEKELQLLDTWLDDIRQLR